MKMAHCTKATELLARESLAAVQSVRSHEPLVRAWEALQERDADGAAIGTLPYTDAAIREFHAALQMFPGDVGVLHHLAIAHHARAWDLELSGDPDDNRRAPAEWQAALEYWYALSVAPEFWRGLKEKLLACRADADPAVVDKAKDSLIEDLLDIHVEFARHHCELGRIERAGSHVESVKRAPISPAAKKTLIGKLFDAMTGSVSASRAAGDFEAALACLEHFMALFPEEPQPYLPALRLHVEVCKDWVSRLSYADAWDEIARVGDRAEPVARHLARHPDLEDNPLAGAALETMASEMAERCLKRAISLRSQDTPGNTEVIAACKIGAKWGRLAADAGQRGHILIDRLVVCQRIIAAENFGLSEDIFHTSERKWEVRDQVLDLQQAAIAALEKALEYDPDNNDVRKDLERVRGRRVVGLHILAAECFHQSVELFNTSERKWEVSEQVLDLQQAAIAALEKALEYDPDNDDIRNELERIRGQRVVGLRILAAECFHHSVDLFNTSERKWEVRDQVLDLCGQAVVFLEKALEYDPDNDEIREELERLREQRDQL